MVHQFLIAVIVSCPLALALLKRAADLARLREVDDGSPPPLD